MGDVKDEMLITIEEVEKKLREFIDEVGSSLDEIEKAESSFEAVDKLWDLGTEVLSVSAALRAQTAFILGSTEEALKFLKERGVVN